MEKFRLKLGLESCIENRLNRVFNGILFHGKLSTCYKYKSLVDTFLICLFSEVTQDPSQLVNRKKIKVGKLQQK